MQVVKRSGKKEEVKFDKIIKRIKSVSKDLNLDPGFLTQRVVAGLYDSIPTNLIDSFLAESAAVLSAEHFNYGKLAARIAISSLHKETDASFAATTQSLYDREILSEQYYEKFLALKDELEAIVNHDSDYMFDYFGFKTLERSYLLRIDRKVVERPQHLFMRVALEICDDIRHIKSLYQLLSAGYYTHATPTLFNAGTKRPQLSSCFLQSTQDSVEGIFSALTDCAQISKYAGGIGFHIHDIRAKGSHIKGTNGTSSGIVPMLKVFNETARFINQAGRRKGSFAAYLEPWHADIKDFLELRKPTGKEELRARDLFLALWIPDLFMERVKNNQEWTLMCPNDQPGLSDCYGEEFNNLYAKYEKEFPNLQKIKAQELWSKILESQLESGMPYILFKDACNTKSNQKNVGTIKSSNLCVRRGTLVSTQDGTFPIEDIVDTDVSIWDGDKWTEVAFQKTDSDASLVRIRLRDGSFFDCTPYHKIPLHDGRKVCAEDITIGSDIAQSTAPTINTGEKQNAAYLKGFLVGDGTFCKTSNNPILKLYWTKYILEKRLIDSANELDVDNHYRKMNHTFAFIQDGDERKSLTALPSRKNELKNWCTVYKEYLPLDIFNWDRQSKCEFIAGVLDADGTIVQNEYIHTYQITSKNLRWLRDFQQLLKSVGVYATIGKGSDAQYRDFKDGYGQYYCQATSRLTISNVAARKLSQIVPFERLPHFSKEGYNPRPKFSIVSSVEELQETDDVYCCNVPTTSNFALANGLMTGNCAEIIEISTPEETAVCNLGSICLPKFCFPGGFDYAMLHKVTKQAVVNLNQVIDKNYYPTDKTERSNSRHRPIGLGVQGLCDVFFKLKIPYESEQAYAIDQRIFATMYHAALEASCELAAEYGPYETYKGSPASQGILQYDLWEQDPHSRLDWDKLKADIELHGLRNSLLLALMPTASTSQIYGNTECFEVVTSNLYKRQTLAGEFVVINKYLINDLENLKLWNTEMRDSIIENNGSIQQINEIPEDIRAIYKTVWEVPQRAVIDHAAIRAPYICQSQSMNLFFAKPSFGSVTSALFYAWQKGLKTGCYYLRTKPSTDAIKVTTKIDNPVAEVIACSLENPETCISCQ